MQHLGIISHHLVAPGSIELLSIIAAAAAAAGTRELMVSLSRSGVERPGSSSCGPVCWLWWWC